METEHIEGHQPDFYELSLLLARSQSRDHTSGATNWESFIDNLSRISDEFAVQIRSKEKPWQEALGSDYRPVHHV